jgi:hypothetical protein
LKNDSPALCDARQSLIKQGFSARRSNPLHAPACLNFPADTP